MTRPFLRWERGDLFLPLFALANAGGVVGYAPLLTLLLPAKIDALAGARHIEWLGAATLAGAIAASIGNIAFGWASDLWGSRRGWTAAGLALTIASYSLIYRAASEAEIVAAIVVYQLALNMFLSPMVAWAADLVPDRRKGLLGGLISAGHPIGALAGVVATLPSLPQEGTRLALVCAIILGLTAPLLVARPAIYADAPAADEAPPERRETRRDFAILWAARLLVQIAGNLLFGFLFYYFESLRNAPSQAAVARLSALALLLAFPTALLFGRISDRLGPRKPFIVAAAAAAAIGMGMMGSENEFAAASLGYILFGCSSAVFLALHSTFSMQLLPSPHRRGRDMGILNLTNTLPAIIAPVLAMWLVPGRGFGPLLTALAMLIAVAGAAILLVRHDVQSS